MTSSLESQEKRADTLAERISLVEYKLTLLEEHQEKEEELLNEIKENNIKIKTMIGAITFVISGLWLVLSTFKETVVHWLTGK